MTPSLGPPSRRQREGRPSHPWRASPPYEFGAGSHGSAFSKSLLSGDCHAATALTSVLTHDWRHSSLPATPFVSFLRRCVEAPHDGSVVACSPDTHSPSALGASKDDLYPLPLPYKAVLSRPPVSARRRKRFSRERQVRIWCDAIVAYLNFMLLGRQGAASADQVRCAPAPTGVQTELHSRIREYVKDYVRLQASCWSGGRAVISSKLACIHSGYSAQDKSADPLWLTAENSALPQTAAVVPLCWGSQSQVAWHHLFHS